MKLSTPNFPSPTLHVLGIQGTVLLESPGVDVVHFVVPPGAGAPPHKHLREQESFLVLKGELSAALHGQVQKLLPGRSLALPPGEPHSFINDSGATAEVLIFLTPGSAGALRFYRDISALPHFQDQVAQVVTLAARHDIEVLT